MQRVRLPKVAGVEARQGDPSLEPGNNALDVPSRWAQEANNGVAQRSYLIECKQGYYRLTIPAELRLTFGPLMPFETKQYNPVHDGSRQHTAIRVYRGKDDCLAVIPGVIAFREVSSLKLEKLVTNGTAESWADNTDGALDRSAERIQMVKDALEGNATEDEGDIPF